MTTKIDTSREAFAGHTPGPWAVNPIKATVDAFDTGEPVPVCRLLWPTMERTEDETFANARLIAAAPALLVERDQLQHDLDEVLAALPHLILAYDEIVTEEYSGTTLYNSKLTVADPLRTFLAKHPAPEPKP